MRTTVLAKALVLVVTTLLLAGCPEAPQGVQGTELRHGDLGVTVTGYDLRYLDLQADNGNVVTTEQPVLLVHLAVTNHSAATVRYDMRDNANIATQVSSPLLFIDPGDGDLTANIPAIDLGALSYLDDPVSGQSSIPPGEVLTDVLLFQPPPENATSLILSLPPEIFGQVEAPGLIRIPYIVPEPQRPPIYSAGAPAQGDGFSITVSEPTVEWVPNIDSTGFTDGPVLVLRYRIANTSDEAMYYHPPHRETRNAAPALTDGVMYYDRLALVPGEELIAQITTTQTIPPGGELRDYLVFRRPNRTVTQLIMTFPGHTVRRNGQLRIQTRYSYSDPPRPAALDPPADDGEPLEQEDGEQEGGGEEGDGEEGDGEEGEGDGEEGDGEEGGEEEDG